MLFSFFLLFRITKVFNECVNDQKTSSSVDCRETIAVDQKKIGETCVSDDTGSGQSISSETSGREQRGKRKNEDIITGNIKKRLNYSDDSDEIRLFECSVCDYSTPYRHNLDKHFLRHNDKKPFQCEICSREYVKKSSFRIHMKNHGQIFPYECGVCGVGFDHANELQRHENNVKVYQCPICSKSFKHRKDNLISHLRTHSSKKVLHNRNMAY